MRSKVLHTIASIGVSLGLFLIIGAVGSSDLNEIDNFHYFLYIGSGILCILIGCISEKIGGFKYE